MEHIQQIKKLCRLWVEWTRLAVYRLCGGSALYRRAVCCLLAVCSVLSLVSLNQQTPQHRIRLEASQHSSVLSTATKMELIRNTTKNIYINSLGPSLKKSATKSNKVLLVTQARGGSSFLGELFNHNEGANYWYETVSAIYQAVYGITVGPHPIGMHYTWDGSLRNFSDFENMWITRYVVDILNGRFERLPMTIWFNKLTLDPKAQWTRRIQMCANVSESHVRSVMFPACVRTPEVAELAECYRYNSTLPDHGRQVVNTEQCAKVETLVKCQRERFREVFLDTERPCFHRLTRAITQSRSRPLNAMKTTRLRMDNVRHILEADSNIKVVYYSRDPRGIILSRIRVGGMEDLLPSFFAASDYLLAAELLCKKMSRDLTVIKELNNKIPGSIYVARYEDYVQNQTKFGADLYRFLGQPITKNLREYMDGTFLKLLREYQASISKSRARTAHRMEDSEQPMSTFRENGMLAANAWKLTLTQEQINNITEKCRDVIVQLDYPLHVVKPPCKRKYMAGTSPAKVINAEEIVLCERTESLLVNENIVLGRRRRKLHQKPAGMSQEEYQELLRKRETAPKRRVIFRTQSSVPTAHSTSESVRERFVGRSIDLTGVDPALEKVKEPPLLVIKEDSPDTF